MPATAIARAAVAAARGGDRLLDQLADVGGEVLELVGVGRVRVQVALGMADRPGLQRGVEADLLAGADDQLGRAAADVEDEGASVAGGRCAVAPR